MPEMEEPLRPRAVTVIGWLWLVAAVFFLLRAVVNLVVWKILQPDMPSLLAFDGRAATQLQFLRPVFDHLTAIQTAETILSAAVIVLAIELLRLREWARVGVQAVCWLVLAYVAAFGSFWFWLWRRIVAAPDSPGTSLGTIGLIAGLAVCLAVAAGLALMIAFLRSSEVREAFHRPPESMMHNAG
jgi:hypothetical protein